MPNPTLAFHNYFFLFFFLLIPSMYLLMEFSPTTRPPASQAFLVQ